MQLIKSGNFNKAESSVDNLIARVRTLIRRERDYGEYIIRDPQVIFFDKRRNRNKNELEIKNQFEEEQKVFQEMFHGKKDRTFPTEQRLEAELVFENLERARMLHNELAKLVVENMALEVKVRVEYPESFWRTSHLSFKKDVWQNIIVKYGLDNFDKLENLLNPLFSPDVEFIYPLDWAWEEQIVRAQSSDIFDIETQEEADEITWNEKGVDWEQLTMLYTPIFKALSQQGKFNFSSLNTLEETDKGIWMQQRENIDMLMMLAITDVTLTSAYNMAEGVDERLELFRRLCEQEPSIKTLEGKTITSYLENDKQGLQWEEVVISPYVIEIR